MDKPDNGHFDPIQSLQTISILKYKIGKLEKALSKHIIISSKHATPKDVSPKYQSNETLSNVTFASEKYNPTIYHAPQKNTNNAPIFSQQRRSLPEAPSTPQLGLSNNFPLPSPPKHKSNSPVRSANNVNHHSSLQYLCDNDEKPAVSAGQHNNFSPCSQNSKIEICCTKPHFHPKDDILHTQSYRNLEVAKHQPNRQQQLQSNVASQNNITKIPNHFDQNVVLKSAPKTKSDNSNINLLNSTIKNSSSSRNVTSHPIRRPLSDPIQNSSFATPPATPSRPANHAIGLTAPNLAAVSPPHSLPKRSALENTVERPPSPPRCTTVIPQSSLQQKNDKVKNNLSTFTSPYNKMNSQTLDINNNINNISPSLQRRERPFQSHSCINQFQQGHPIDPLISNSIVTPFKYTVNSLPSQSLLHDNNCQAGMPAVSNSTQRMLSSALLPSHNTAVTIQEEKPSNTHHLGKSFNTPPPVASPAPFRMSTDSPMLALPPRDAPTAKPHEVPERRASLASSSSIPVRTKNTSPSASKIDVTPPRFSIAAPVYVRNHTPQSLHTSIPLPLLPDSSSEKSTFSFDTLASPVRNKHKKLEKQPYHSNDLKCFDSVVEQYNGSLSALFAELQKNDTAMIREREEVHKADSFYSTLGLGDSPQREGEEELTYVLPHLVRSPQKKAITGTNSQNE